MITHFDASSLLKLIVDERGSDQVVTIWDAADAVASASLIVVEARAALAAAERAGRLSASDHGKAKGELARLIDGLVIVKVTEELVAQAAGLAEEEALRGYDAVHLAAALTIEATVLASADDALCDAAARRGLHVANPLDD